MFAELLEILIAFVCVKHNFFDKLRFSETLLANHVRTIEIGPTPGPTISASHLEEDKRRGQWPTRSQNGKMGKN